MLIARDVSTKQNTQKIATQGEKNYENDKKLTNLGFVSPESSRRKTVFFTSAPEK